MAMRVGISSVVLVLVLVAAALVVLVGEAGSVCGDGSPCCWRC